MMQVLQNLGSGHTELVHIPSPRAAYGSVLIRTTCSLVSLGTERMLVRFGQSSYLDKARQQPEKVRMVIDKVKTDGLLPTIDSVRRKLGEPIPLGYCNVGTVVEVGAGVTGFAPGDRVASNGPHAEFAVVPENLCARIPEDVSDEHAAFTVVGAIGLQGLRLADPTFGETVVIIGLGLIGLLTGQLARANGCRVIGIEPDPAKRTLAESIGLQAISPDHAVADVTGLTGGIGADAVIITASADSDTIVADAARMSRKRGRIILIGVVGLNLNRAHYYEKELTFQVSCSYGPGRYESNYEQKGLDYPIGFVRWTEQRNFQAVLGALSNGQLIVEPLISERVPLKQMGYVYANISTSNSIATLFQYEGLAPVQRSIEVTPKVYAPRTGTIGVIGAGNFTKMTVMPALAKANADVRWIVSSKGVTSTILAREYGVAFSSTNYREMLKDDSVGTVIITTQHDTHFRFATEAMRAGKDVFIEKPLVITRDELQRLAEVQEETERTVTVGFNRRFSPHARSLRRAISSGIAKNMLVTVNAGHIPPDFWVHDPGRGGGRIIGEACHFVDLLRYLSGSPIVAVCANSLGDHPAATTDNATILLRFANGDQGTIAYYANGHKSFPKERVEVLAGERVYQIDNFRKTIAYGDSAFKQVKTKLDKGHEEQFRLLQEAVCGKRSAPLIPFEELVNVTEATFAALESIVERRWVTL